MEKDVMVDKLRPNLSVAISGLPKTGKSHFCLTFPSPLAVFSFDIGLEPVLAKFPTKVVKLYTYDIPILETVRAEGLKKDITAIWDKFALEFKKVTEDTKIKTVVVDTGTAAYEICRIGRTGELGRELDPVEYGNVYLRMKALIQRTRLSGQNFVSTHYLKEVYGSDRRPTGELKLDGWKGTGAEVDVVLTIRRETRMVAAAGKAPTRKGFTVVTVNDNRYDMDLNGTEIENMDYEKLCVVLGV